MLKKLAVALLAVAIVASVSDPAFARRSSSGHSTTTHHASSHRSSVHIRKQRMSHQQKLTGGTKLKHCKSAGCYNKHPNGSYLVHSK